LITKSFDLLPIFTIKFTSNEKKNLKWHKEVDKKRKLKEKWKWLVEADIKYINKNIFIDLKTKKFKNQNEFYL
jgi:hypothetical protein